MVGRRVDFARAGVGVAVKAGAPKPDISTPEAFKHAMLAAKSIAYSRTGASGTHRGEADGAARALRAIEGQDQTSRRRPDRRGRGKRRSRGWHAADQRHLAGCRRGLWGPLPGELQGYVDFAVGVLAVSKERDAAQELLKFMSSPEAAPLIRKSGMEPTPR